MPNITLLVAAFIASAVIAFTSASASQHDGVDLVIEDARLILGDGNIIENGGLVIHEGKIVSIHEDVIGLSAKRRIDAAGQTVLPGFIDTHVHILTDAMADSDEALQAWIDRELVNLLQAYLAAGFTSVLSMGDPFPAIMNVSTRLNSGAIKGPRLFVAGPMITAAGGHPARTVCWKNEWCRQNFAFEARDSDIARSKVRELARAGADAVKVVYDGAPMFPELPDHVLAALTDEAQANDMPVMVHATEPTKTLKATELGVTHVAHAASQGAFSDDQLARPSIAGLPVSTAAGRMNRDRRNPPRLANLRRLHDAGALIAFGTDIGGMGPADALAMEVGDLSTVMSPEEVLASLTKNAAAFLGVGDRIGTIAVGYDADLAIINGDPLSNIENLRNVILVIKQGEIMVERNIAQ